MQLKIGYAAVLLGIMGVLSEAAWSVERNGMEYLVGPINKGQMGKFTISPDGMRVAYVAAASGKAFEPEPDENRKIIVILDGQKSKSYDYSDIAEKLIFSADSKRLAYIAYQDQKLIAVVDGNEIDLYGEGSNRDPGIQGIHSLQFSPDSSHYAYVADSYQASGPEFVVVDGKQGKPYQNVNGITFSPDGKRIGYFADTNKGDFLVVDGQEGKRYEYIVSDNNLVFSPNSSRFAYTAGRLGSDRHHFVVVGDQEGKRYAGIAIGPRFSPDSQRVFYVAQVGPGMNWSVVVDGKEDKYYSGAMPYPIFSPDSLRVAYVASVSEQNNSEQFVVLDGHEKKRFSKVEFNSFSPDSKRIAYRGRTADGKKWFAVIDEKEAEQYDGVGKIIFSPDSTHVAYVAKIGSEQVVVLDGKEGSRYDTILDLAFTSNGNTLAYVAYSGKEKKWFVIVNGQKGEAYDQILSSGRFGQSGIIHFDSAESLHYLVVKDKRNIYIVKEKWSKRN